MPNRRPRSSPKRRISSAAFERIYRDNYDFVFRCVCRLGITSGADDVVQEVFITAYRRLDTYAGRGSVKAWLGGIARRVVFRSRRGETRRARRHELLAAVPPETEDLDRALERSDAARHLDAFLETLDADKRTAFVLCELESLTGREVAERLGVNQNTVHARLRAARMRFAAACEAYGGDLAQSHAETRPDSNAAQRGWLAFTSSSAVSWGPAGAAGASWVVQTKALLATLVVGGGALAIVDQALPRSEPRQSVVASAPPRPKTEPRETRPPSLPVTRPAAAPEPDPELVVVEPTPVVPKRRPRRSAEAKPSDGGLSEAELQLLSQARAHARGQRWEAAAEAARRLTREHPRSDLTGDADAILLEALCRLGDDGVQTVAARLPTGQREAILAKHCES